MKSQAGYGLLFLLLVGSVGYGLFVPILSEEYPSTLENFEKLKRAKKQLLAYARSFPFTESSAGNPRAGLPPMLPCPSLEGVSSDGSERGSCGALNKVSIGLFPWKSLGTQPLFSAQGECVWYVVSGNVKRNNIQTKTHFNLDGDEWIKYQNKKGVAALLSPKESRSREAKTARFRCRQSYDPEDIFSLNSSASFDVENADVEIDLSNEDSFDVELVSRSEVLAHYAQSETYRALIGQLGETLARCLSSVSSFSTTTLQWSTPFAAKMALSDDRKRDDYKAKSGLYLGRFPYQFSRSAHLENQCRSLFTSGTGTNAVKTSPLFRVWLHSKNYWFLKVLPNCQPSGDDCLKKGSDAFFAIIAYANQALDGQSRISARFDSSDRNNIANYLEGEALSVFQSATTTLSQSCLGTQSNDRCFCLDVNKLFKPC